MIQLNLNLIYIKFIDFMLKNKSLVEFTNYFSPYDFIKNDDIILSYFR